MKVKPAHKLSTTALVIAVLCLCTNLFAQDRMVDSLKLVLKNAKHDTVKINALSALSEVCEIDDIPLYANQCKDLCEKKLSGTSLTNTLTHFYKKNLAGAFNNLGYYSSQKNDKPGALEFYQKSIAIYEEINDVKDIGNPLNNIGRIYDNYGDASKALNFYEKALKSYMRYDNKIGMGSLLNNIGIVYNKLGDIPKALDYAHRSLKIQEDLHNKSGIAISLCNIGLMYSKHDNVSKALEYYQRAMKIQEVIKEQEGLGTTLNNIGLLYYGQDSILKALEYYEKSLRIYEEGNHKKGIAIVSRNIGNVYKNYGEKLAGVKRPTEAALEYYKKSLTLMTDIKDKEGIAYSLDLISKVMLEQGQLAEALDYAMKSLTISKELGYPINISRAANMLKSIYKKQNKFKEAFEMYELEIQMQDSVNNTETKKASIKKQFQYEYEKQTAADSVKHAEEHKVKNAQLTAQAASLKQEQTQRYALYGGLLLVIGFSAFVFNRFKVTQKQKKVIEEQKVLVDNAYQQLHEKNKEVMDSITYARRIQHALLTPESYIDRNLNRLSNKN
ncbi:MAG: tetratricopeptide repeat protein [Bacteroidota bacterium]